MEKRKNKCKKVVEQKNSNKNDDIALKTRRSSMRVNLSFVSDLSDSEYSLSNKSNVENNENATEESSSQNDVLQTVKKCGTKKIYINGDIIYSNPTNITDAINDNNVFVNNVKVLKRLENNSFMNINEKEKRFNKSCTHQKQIFDKENEQAIKTLKALAITSISPKNYKISPNVRNHIRKNEQTIILSNGKTQNPVKENCMLTDNFLNQQCNLSSKTIDEYHQNIVSTPKKSRIENRINKIDCHGKISHRLLKIPIVRLFNDASNTNNSKSKINSLRNPNSLKSIIVNANETNQNNLNIIDSNELNCTSPILSQGMRKNRSSLKKKHLENLSQISSRLSSTIINEKFSNGKMFTCSSFIDPQSNTDFTKRINKTCKFSRQDEKEKVNNCNTIDLINSKDHDKSINTLSNKNQSNMEMTVISSHMPIIERSFQHIIKESIDNVINGCNKGIQNRDSLIQEQESSIIIKNLNKQINNFEQVKQTDSNKIDQNLQINTNSLLQQMKLVNYITQKENIIQINTKKIISKSDKNPIEENNTIIHQQNTNSLSSSIQESTSLKNNKTLFILDISNEKLEKHNKVTCLKSSNQKQNSGTIISRQPSTSTIRSSMQVNTSLDSIKKSPITKTILDFNKILSVVVETSSNENQNNDSKFNSKDQSCDDEIENVSLMKRINHLSAIKESYKRKLNEAKSTSNKSTTDENIDLNSNKKFIENKDTNPNSSDISIIEGTPYPMSRSALYKTIIKNNIATSTLDPKRFIETLLHEEESSNELQTIISKKKTDSSNKNKVQNEVSSDKIILNSSHESLSESNIRKELSIVNENLNNTKIYYKTKSHKKLIDKQKNKKMVGKRKLYSLQENSQIISFTPTETNEKLKEGFQNIKKRKPKNTKRKNQQKKLNKRKQESMNESEPLKNSKKVEKIKKKSKKIISKKIIVKKVTNMTILDNMMMEQEKLPQRLSIRSSLNEFDLKNMRNQQKHNHKNTKIIIAVTGLTKEEKNLVKSVIKTLGSASLEANVTVRTTHVISSGIRTINLLKGILRGCWLLSLEWVLKSLENNRWLEPNPYEMSHFSKAVQENRRDRQLFGKAYVSELFVTCGFIYIENGTSPPKENLKELVKIAGGNITEDPNKAEIIIGSEGLKEIWVLDSITTGEVQSPNQYKRNREKKM